MRSVWHNFVDTLLLEGASQYSPLRITLLKYVGDVAQAVPSNMLCETLFARVVSRTLPEVGVAEPIHTGVASETDTLFCRARLALLSEQVKPTLLEVENAARDACVWLNLGERARAADVLLWLDSIVTIDKLPLIYRFMKQAGQYLEASLIALPDDAVGSTMRLRALVTKRD